MKLHIVTIGAPKLAYAKLGWQEYWKRLGHYHTIRATHIADKHADLNTMRTAVGNAYLVALVIAGRQFSSHGLSDFLERQAQHGRELCFLIGGPDGLPTELIEQADLSWSFSELTLPHDLAMVVLLESLYRASTIAAGQPYHK